MKKPEIKQDKLTRSEMEHILALIWMNECEGTYQGGRKHWQKRNEQIKRKLTAMKEY